MKSTPLTQSNSPHISPVVGNEPRPFWSVMIPTFNCALYLRRTLESVLSQDSGISAMQIEVVDDCSTKDDPEAVVNELGQGRVSFYRQPKNVGAITNFNTCIERSRGHLVHILHGDDCVLNGFYKKIAAMAHGHPDCALYATRCFIIDADGFYAGIIARVPEWERKPSRAAQPLFDHNPLQFPGVVVRRDFYESTGGFLPHLVHTADWEMWDRAVSLRGGLLSPDVLALYRVFAGNDTGRLRRTAENLADEERLAEILAQRHDDFDLASTRKRIFVQAYTQEEFFRSRGDAEAAAANRAFRKVRSAWWNMRIRATRSLRAFWRRIAS